MKKQLYLFKKISLSVVIILNLIIIESCKKENKPIKKMAFDQALLNSKASTSAVGIPSYPLDWENITFMPSPTNVTPVPMPWQSGLGGRKIDDDIVYDYKKSDGWELVYNTFNTSTVFNPSYFMLYNKYRGLLRTYFYFSTPSSYPSSNITYLLNLRGAGASSSPMLNFAAKDMINLGSNTTDVSQIQPYLVSNTGSWYATEFEIAYDPRAASTNYQDLQLDWQINPNTISQITLNGVETGTVSGTIEQQKSGTDFFGGVVNGALDGGIKLGSKTAADKIKFIKNSSILTSISNAATNGIGGVIKGFFSGILGGSTSTTSTQQVNLKINSTIATTGQGVTQNNLFDNIFTLPGTLNNQNSTPFYPNYNIPMGVFYISNTPVVKIQRTLSNINRPPTIDGARTKFTFSIDDNSFQILFNPALQADADISNIRKEVIFTTALGDLDRQNSILSEENVAGIDLYGNLSYFTRIGNYPTSSVNTQLAVRIAFDVVPKNGSQKITIVKTFKAIGQQL